MTADDISNENKKQIEKIVPPLIAWYQNNRRALPWRKDPTPYHVWISEIMLQQTRIEAALPYYERFLQEVPSIRALASIEDDKLMKLWEGLGYYSRARNLKKAANLLLTSYGGQLPCQISELKKLPGIGDYTAGAIASIAYGQPEPAVDGNVLRILARLTASHDDITLPKTKSAVIRALREIYPAGPNAALLTEGLMELGEVICIPNGEPNCLKCPAAAHCRAHSSQTVSQYPVKSAKKSRKIEQHTILLLSCRGKYAIHRRKNQGLLAGLWEFPNFNFYAAPADIEMYLHSLKTKALSCAPCGEAKHIFSHVEWHMRGYAVECSEETQSFLWKSPEEIKTSYAIPSAFRFYLGLL